MEPAQARSTTSAVSPVAACILAVLADFTAFPHALLTSVCERSGRDIAGLDHHEMPALIHALALQIALFNDVDAGFAVKRRLLLALRGC